MSAYKHQPLGVGKAKLVEFNSSGQASSNHRCTCRSKENGSAWSPGVDTNKDRKFPIIMRFYRRDGHRRWSFRFKGDEDVATVPLLACHFNSICLS